MSPCVQPKGMGGHPGGFTNIHLRTEGGECKIACGKKITKDEIIMITLKTMLGEILFFKISGI